LAQTEGLSQLIEKAKMAEAGCELESDSKLGMTGWQCTCLCCGSETIHNCTLLLIYLVLFILAVQVESLHNNHTLIARILHCHQNFINHFVIKYC